MAEGTRSASPTESSLIDLTQPRQVAHPAIMGLDPGFDPGAAVIARKAALFFWAQCRAGLGLMCPPLSSSYYLRVSKAHIPPPAPI